jgi:6-phosphogluconolactonase
MLRVFADEEALSRAAAELLADQAALAVARRGRCTVLLAGGSTPRRTYERLATAPLRDRIPWAQIHWFWGDERCLPEGDPNRNESMARTALLDHVPVRPEFLHPIRCDGAPAQAAAAYAAELEAFFGADPPCFDLVLLGMGTDGHTASLLPGSSSLDEQVQWTAVTRRPEEPFGRVTLTAPLLNQAALVVILVTGRNKAGVLRAAFEENDRQPLLPVQLIRPLNGALHWLVDREAASLLAGTDADE